MSAAARPGMRTLLLLLLLVVRVADAAKSDSS
jgi:hypothetical protein